MNANEGASFDFHNINKQNCRGLVLNRANLGVLPPQRPWLAGVHPVLRRWIRMAQLEILLWEQRLHIIFWTSRIEKAWQEVFAHPKVRHLLDVSWKRHLGVVTQPPSANTVPYTLNDIEWYLNSDSWTIGSDILRQYLVSAPQSKRLLFIQNWHRCEEAFIQYQNARNRRYAISQAAQKYIQDGGEQDFTWQQNFTRESEQVKKEFSVAITRFIRCQELSKALGADYYENLPGDYEKQVQRLIKSNDTGGTKDDKQSVVTVDDPNEQDATGPKETSPLIRVPINESRSSVVQPANKDVSSPNEKKSVENHNLQNDSPPNASGPVSSPSQHDDPAPSPSPSETAETTPPMKRQRPDSVENQNRSDPVIPFNDKKYDISPQSRSGTTSATKQPYNPTESQTQAFVSLRKDREIPVTDIKDSNALPLTPPTEASDRKLVKKEDGGQVKKAEVAKNKDNRGVENN
jgi:hypothetical protein